MNLCYRAKFTCVQPESELTKHKQEILSLKMEESLEWKVNSTFLKFCLYCLIWHICCLCMWIKCNSLWTNTVYMQFVKGFWSFVSFFIDTRWHWGDDNLFLFCCRCVNRLWRLQRVPVERILRVLLFIWRKVLSFALHLLWLMDTKHTASMKEREELLCIANFFILMLGYIAPAVCFYLSLDS